MTNPVQRTIVDAASFLARNQVGADKDGGGSSTTSSADVVAAALESVLGAPPDASVDFPTLLGRAFTTEEVDGHTETTYRRPTTAGPLMLSEGGGTFTGAQASIVTRAQQARTEILTNLDPLVPLALTPDPDAVRDVRSLIRGAVDSVVDELSRPGGPTLVRVDRLLVDLAGQNALSSPSKIDADNPAGLLLRLRDVFGLRRSEISSLDDERTYTSFVTIVGTVASLCFAWKSDRKDLDPLAGAPFLGTQLVQIERALAVVGQGVEEARRALDRAEVEPKEREAPIAGGQPSLGAVLSWVAEFAKQGHERLRSGGQDGIASFVAEVDELTRLVSKLYGFLRRGAAPLSLSGVRSQPVLDALRALRGNLRNVGKLARKLQSPVPQLKVTEVWQSYLLQPVGGGGLAVCLHVKIFGSGFDAVTNVTFGVQKLPSRKQMISGSVFEATAVVPRGTVIDRVVVSKRGSAPQTWMFTPQLVF